MTATRISAHQMRARPRVEEPGRTHPPVASPAAPAMEQSALLQRTVGNQALAAAAGGPPPAAELSRATLQGILQRAPAHGLAAVSSARTPAGWVQRLISADDFAYNTTFWFTTGKSDAFFKQVADRLRTYEGPLKKAEPAEKMEHLRSLYLDVDRWTLEPESAQSSRLNHAMSLLKEIRTELLTLQKADPEAVKASKGNLANTSSGSSGAPVDQTAPLTDAQKAALEIVDQTALAGPRKAHARDMIRNPETIEQAAFGVCGLTSILFAVAQSSPRRFAEMIRDAWADTALVKAWLPVFHLNATAPQQRVHAEVEYVTSQWLLRHSTQDKVQQRVLDEKDRNQVIDKEKTLTEVIKRQREFSDEFEIKGWENVKGHFALTSGGVNYLVSALGSGKPAYKIKIRDFAGDWATAQARAGAKGSVLTSVIETDFYKQNGAPVDKSFVKTRKPKYVHWVVLKEVKPEGAYFKLKLWTWANTFNATVKKDVINSYIYSFVVAEAEA